MNTEPNFRYFRYSLVGISVFSLFEIPTSVSVSVFENIGYRFGISVYRLTTTVGSLESRPLGCRVIVSATVSLSRLGKHGISLTHRVIQALKRVWTE